MRVAPISAVRNGKPARQAVGARCESAQANMCSRQIAIGPLCPRRHSASSRAIELNAKLSPHAVIFTWNWLSLDRPTEELAPRSIRDWVFALVHASPASPWLAIKLRYFIM